MGRLSTVKLLHQSGASSTSEIQRWYSSATCSILPDKDDKLREVLDYVQTILASPASLKHQCRLFVSRMIGWRDRHARVRQLPVTPEVQDYVMFLDVLSSEDGAHVYQWKLSDVES
nr:hypothetical protein BaRGS_024135 [Batillaria attramentaria]